MTPKFALKLQGMFPPDNNFMLSSSSGAQESWLALVWHCQTPQPDPQLQSGAKQGCPWHSQSMMITHPMVFISCSHNQAFLETEDFVPFCPFQHQFVEAPSKSHSLLQSLWLSLELNQLLCVPAYCPSHSHSSESDSALLKHLNFHFSIFFLILCFPLQANFWLHFYFSFLPFFVI